jgi:hypothetical protein
MRGFLDLLRLAYTVEEELNLGRLPDDAIHASGFGEHGGVL